MNERLAIEGGTPLRARPLPGWPHFAEDERAAVEAVLRSGAVNYWTGSRGREFERMFAGYVGREHSIAVANGTVALELALWALGIRDGDDVVVPARTFIATASAAAMQGARPVVADIDPTSQNVTAETIRAALTDRTRAVVVTHLSGWPCEMAPIMRLAEEHGLRVVEDCAQALGATDGGSPVGSFGHAAAFSFCQDKIMTTGGEGGMLVLDGDELFETAWSRRDHGKSYRAVHDESQHSGSEFRWLHERFGTNWRMTEMQAAIGLTALPKVPDWLRTRRSHAALLNERLGRLPALRVTLPAPTVGHAYYKYYAFVRPERLRPGWDRSRVVEAVNAEGIPCFTGSCPQIHLERCFDGIRPTSRLPVAETLGETSLMLLVHPTLGRADIESACEAVEKVMRRASIE